MDPLFSFPVGLFHPLQHAGCSENTCWSGVLSRALGGVWEICGNLDR
jgi:hypothetical protein